MLASLLLSQLASVFMVVGMTAKAETALPFQRRPFNSCKSLKFLLIQQFLMSGDQPGSKLLLEGFTKIHSAL